MQNKLEAAASSKGLGLQNMKNVNNILTTPKTLMYSTNLTLSDDSSTMSDSRNKYLSKEGSATTNTSSSGNNIFIPMQTSILNMDSLVKIANNKLFDFIAEVSFENQSKTESIETCNLKRKSNEAREACTFAK